MNCPGNRNGRRSQLSLFLILAAALALAGCSPYLREWNKRAAQPLPGNTVAGAWEGTWLSDSGKHGGKLWCIMTPETNQTYEARFRATYAKVFRFTYTAHFEMQPHDIGWEFDGESYLGKLGGTYYYEGRATSSNMVSTYKSKYEKGRFELKRPEAQE
jgi:hypothetical protein